MVYFAPDAPKDHRDAGPVLDTLLGAIIRRRRVRFWYSSNANDGREPAVHEVAPLTLMFWRSALYFLGQFKAGTRPYQFALERVRRMEPTDEHFEYPSAEEYAPDQLMDGAFGMFSGNDRIEVELVFARESWLQRYVQERAWHPTQQFEALADGRLRMTFTVRSMARVWPWIRQFGEAVEVVKPGVDSPRESNQDVGV